MEPGTAKPVWEARVVSRSERLVYIPSRQELLCERDDLKGSVVNEPIHPMPRSYLRLRAAQEAEILLIRSKWSKRSHTWDTTTRIPPSPLHPIFLRRTEPSLGLRIGQSPPSPPVSSPRKASAWPGSWSGSAAGALTLVSSGLLPAVDRYCPRPAQLGRAVFRNIGRLQRTRWKCRASLATTW